MMNYAFQVSTDSAVDYFGAPRGEHDFLVDLSLFETDFDGEGLISNVSTNVTELVSNQYEEAFDDLIDELSHLLGKMNVIADKNKHTFSIKKGAINAFFQKETTKFGIFVTDELQKGRSLQDSSFVDTVVRMISPNYCTYFIKSEVAGASHYENALSIREFLRDYVEGETYYTGIIVNYDY